MATLAPSLSRAQEILKDLRQKQESLIANNPSLQRCLHHDRPPIGPSTRKTNTSVNQQGSDRAKEILVDLKAKRASLTAVLDACRSPGSPGKKRDRSITTAPTAASTRSWLSSNVGDDDSFSYSETSFDSPRGESTSVEFIFDTEDSDLYSLSTREEVERAVGKAVGTIYEEVIPRALSAIQKKRATQESSPSCTKASSWTFQSKLSARNLYHEERTRLTISEKKKRRSKVSEKRRAEAKERKKKEPFAKSDASLASSVSPSVDLEQLHQQRSILMNMLQSVSELQEMADASVSCSQESPPIRRPTVDESPSGSEPISARPPSTNKQEPTPSHDTPSPTKKIDFDMTKVQIDEKKKRTRKKKKDSNLSSASIASHYVLETKEVYCRKKKVGVKLSGPYTAPTLDLNNIVHPPDSDESLLVTPPLSDDDESLLASPLQHESAGVKPRKGSATHSRKHSRTLDTKSEESPFLVFEEDKLHVIQKNEGRKSTPSSVNNDFNNDIVSPDGETGPSIPLPSQYLSDMEPTPEEPRSQQNYLRKTTTFSSLEDKVVFTMEDIIREMNRLAAENASKGLTIPSGTVITLRRGKDEQPADVQSYSGWSFSEPSDLSSCSYTLAPLNQAFPRPDAEDEWLESDIGIKDITRAEEDITERFCGGLYHIAVMSGMSTYSQQEI
jgi:hypothetical protein